MSETKGKMKVSEWLAKNTDGHAIQDSAKLGASYYKATGLRADWPEHTVKSFRDAIAREGRGGYMKGDDNTLCCSGLEVAEHLAEKFGDGNIAPKFGRGSRFWEAVESIKRKGN